MDPWLKIKQNCPMCKCSITSSPSTTGAVSGPPPPHDSEDDDNFAVAVAVMRSVSPVSEGSDDISILNLRQMGGDEAEGGDGEEEGGSEVSQDTFSTQASDIPLLAAEREGAVVEEVELMPYSPQVEVNMESLNSPPSHDTT